MSGELDPLLRELESAARTLRAGGLDGADAAELVQRCADLATEVAAEIDRLAREASLPPPDSTGPSQEQLL